ncbi:MAG: 7-carboxy-7-deazaguanine synthase QueE [Mycobacterium kyogaense]|uniref:7-carboxy-7-deazaguanine synthase QueE n=1 Tax=Mycobacterium kyogaense TaxID=2212479 RepID=UPI002FF6D492
MEDDRQDPVPSVSTTLSVVELFGPTIQGEGPSVGNAAQFLRLAGCNLTCVWCDTAFSWDSQRRDPDRPPRTITINEALEHLDPRFRDPFARAPLVKRLVVTGGEPLLQASQLAELLVPLSAQGWAVEVETSGSVPPGPVAALATRFNVSPKLSHSRVAEKARLRIHVLDRFAVMPSSIFKFVVQDSADLREIETLLNKLSVLVPPERVYVMAQGSSGTTVLERSRSIVDDVVARGWSLTPRWHTLLWNDERGR